ncbi:flagellar assembly factor FliW [Pullulanibacillus pueri]|uniref:Flagellar assembly factor FliW n=1 Tax=Pullulanibacillus pueri TaxID=1437324 RepID=A0A8J3EKT2_9BACL|nr:flagellar assembly protein FliW [Pullulanibacillus pueri]MBM7684127.1 flagellar assembly factor FliW [Pullulanibacillus pueri]GGH76716.1 flagellar assembly factor FliW [Pullulanibacillus pueri]
MITINTKYFGIADIEKDEIIHFQTGLPGFPDEREFVFMPLERNSPYEIMQSTKTPAVAFVTVSPFLIFKDYEIDINDQTTKQLQLKAAKDASVYTILTLKEPFAESTANLVAPVIVHHHKQLGKQVVLEKTDYHTKHPILQEDPEKEGRHADTHKKVK